MIGGPAPGSDTERADRHAAAGARPVLSVKPIVLPAPGRGEDLRVKVSAPTTGSALPIVVFAHGYGSSLEGYGPLVDLWAAHGFVVIQPTFLDSRTVALPADDPRTRRLWQQRVDDLVRILDGLDEIEAAVPFLAARLDRSRIAAAGHSFGGQSAGNLLGLRVLDPDGTGGEDRSDPRIKAGVLLATAGRGGADLTPFAAEHFPFMHADFTHMTAPALVVAGDRDDSPLTVRGPDWSADPYTLSPGPKTLLELFGAEHSLGGIPGYEAAETTDERPPLVAFLAQLTTAYLHSALDPEDPSWAEAVAELAADPEPLGRITSK